jgi:hypothetical protein
VSGEAKGFRDAGEFIARGTVRPFSMLLMIERRILVRVET